MSKYQWRCYLVLKDANNVFNPGDLADSLNESESAGWNVFSILSAPNDNFMVVIRKLLSRIKPQIK